MIIMANCFKNMSQKKEMGDPSVILFPVAREFCLCYPSRLVSWTGAERKMGAAEISSPCGTVNLHIHESFIFSASQYVAYLTQRDQDLIIQTFHPWHRFLNWVDYFGSCHIGCLESPEFIQNEVSNFLVEDDAFQFNFWAFLLTARVTRCLDVD